MKKLKKLGLSLKLYAAVLLIISLSSCCTTQFVEVPVVVPIALLEPPDLPVLTVEQENKIDNPTFIILSEREETLIQHIIRVNKLIMIHNKETRVPDT